MGLRFSLVGMATIAKSRKSMRKPTSSPKRTVPAAKVKFPVDHPFAGLEHVFGSVALDIPSSGPKRRAHIRARILADHNT